MRNVLFHCTLFLIWGFLAVSLLFPQNLVQEEKEEIYHTPLAGEPLDIDIAGEHVHIPARDRRSILALNLGSSLFIPKIGGHYFIPFAALYYRKHWNKDLCRLRAVISGVVNYIDFAEGSWNTSGWEFLSHWENFTVPFPTAEIVSGEEIEDSEIYWGHFLGAVGFGWRVPLFPYHCDNDFKAQIFYELGYLYIKETSKTGENVVLPPNTLVQQIHLRLRQDTFDRNIMELPHRGLAWGIDLILGRRDHWTDHRFSEGIAFSRDRTRDYLRITGYMVGAVGIPFLSERHRLLGYWHLGWSPKGNWDRFSALRVGGGPAPSESNDLSRHPFPGALFDQFITERYILLTIEYRVEILFFLYFHFRATLGWAHLAGVDKQGRLEVSSIWARSFSIGMTTGFLWDSMLYIEYSYDNGVVRKKDSGHAILISWSKEL